MAILVRLYVTAVKPETDAVTLWAPAAPLAVAVTLATPATLVVAGVADSAADAPEPDALGIRYAAQLEVKITGTH